MLLPGNVLLDIKPRKFLNKLPKAFEGPYKLNEDLAKTTKLFRDEIFGAESLAIFDGKMVTGSADGYLYRLDGQKPKRLIKLLAKSCFETHYNTPKCGRPLGLKFDTKGVLYVVEPNVGVFSVQNLFTNNPKVTLVFDIEETRVLGKSSKFLDDLTIDEGSGLGGGHVLYVSDVSVKFSLFEFPLSVMGSDTGRIVKYDINSKKVESIADQILFPNGMEISDDKNAILYNEFVGRRVMKVYIKGPKKGQSEVLVSELPGEPDNIRRSASTTSETYWVALLSARTATKPNELDYYLRKPLLRKFYCRVIHLFGNAIEKIGNLFGSQLIQEYGIDMKRGKFFDQMILHDESNDHAMIVEIDINGNVLNSLQATDPSLTRLSEVREVRISDKESVLYLGSFINNYLGKLAFKR